MKREVELLAPGGDIDSIKAAIAAGADAIYCGLNRFNARNRATNISFDQLNGILSLARRNHCKVFLTLNIIIVESEIPALVRELNKLINTRVDAVIVQDLGLFYLLNKYFKGLDIHASTQLNTHNEGQVKFLSKLGASRVNLSRELNIDEIKALTAIGHENNISTEVFVHGSYCISFSGICYISSVLGGKSGNRGRCSQPCRDRYLTTPEGKNYPLNLKDNSAYSDLRELSDAGVASLKIEGRIKKFDYVYTVVNCWKRQIREFYEKNRLNADNSDLYKVFNRDFSNSFLTGDIGKNMFIDNPKDHSIKSLSDSDNYSTMEEKEKDRIKYYDDKSEISTLAKDKIKQLSVAKSPLIISVSGDLDTPLKISVKTPDTSFDVLSENNLVNAGTLGQQGGNPAGSGACERKSRGRAGNALNYQALLEKLKTLNDTEYYIRHMELDNLQSGLFLSFKELTSMKKRILFILNGSREVVDPIDVPVLKKQGAVKSKPSLSVLISDPKDLHVCDQTSADIFFQLPSSLNSEDTGYADLFLENRKLIPWFPSILIGENYTAAVELLEKVQPELIVTNNTGVAYEAFKNGISWIAGPYLNIVNSFSLLCLKETFNCCGSFISNEISRKQMKKIVRPDNFNLYYSIYHPILLLSSRQCLFHQTIGCGKNKIDEDCIPNCRKHATITNLKNVSLPIEKTEGNYHCIYNSDNFLNTDIVTDLPDTFSSFFIDLRDVKTDTAIETDKSGIIKRFENFLDGDAYLKKELKKMIHPSTDVQYKKGI